MSGLQDFSGLWVPLVTPFDQGQLDLGAFKRLVWSCRDAGARGVVVCGSTGEAAALDDDEQLALLDTALRAAGNVAVVMGMSGYQLTAMRQWVMRLNPYPLAGLLLPPPCYIRPSQAGLMAWFETLADASTAPLIIYDIPYRTGVTLELATLRALARHPRIRAIKDCGGDPAKTRALILDGSLQVLAGEDASIFDTVAQGGAGAIAASAHLRTGRFVRLLALLRAGELDAARQVWQELAPLIEICFAEPNPAPVKAMLAAQGRLRNELRLPMMPATVALQERLELVAAGVNRP